MRTQFSEGRYLYTLYRVVNCKCDQQVTNLPTAAVFFITIFVVYRNVPAWKLIKAPELSTVSFLAKKAPVAFVAKLAS